MDTLDEELHFLILRYLQEGPCKEAAKVFKEEVKKYQLLPKRIDWEGRNYPRAYDELVSTHPHIAANHLKRICSRLPTLLDDKFPPSVRGVQSLLGAGSQSLLRSEKTAGVKLRPSGYLYSQNSELLPLPNNLQHRPHLLRCVQGTQYTGLFRSAETQPVEIYGNYQLQRRFLGHLSAVYCVLYDRTGNFIFTGSDDKLVKIWSAMTGRLLATLRGHGGEIVDLAVNYENTVLASGSCDKTVRLWSLKTTACLAVLHGHTATVTSLKFCPLAKGEWRFLVSTGEDATVCFWQYNKVEMLFEARPIKFIERSRMGAKMLCSSFSPGGLFLATGNSDSVIRIYCLIGNNPDKIGELEAHHDEVDSIQYSNHSERFISGSKDGTARIWRHMRNDWLNLILNMQQGASQSGSTSTSTLKVNMVEWTADDKFVLTAVSDFSVRVWCSSDGSFLRSLTGHEDDVFVIECAKFSSNLVVTAAHDGRLKVWDIVSGRTLMNYYNMIDGQGFGAMFDCKWSPHGHAFSATDSHGHLMRFGLGRNERLDEERIPTELYFHTDYRGLIRDANEFVVDELVQRAVHILPPPFLVDAIGNPHPPKFQRLVPGRESLPEQYLVPVFIDLPNGEREVIDQEIPVVLQHPLPPAASNQSSSSPVPTTTQSADSIPSSSHSVANSTLTSQASTSQDANTQEADANLGNDAGEGSNPSAGDSRNRYLRQVIFEMGDRMLKALENERIAVTEQEHSHFTAEMKKRPFRDDEQLMSGTSDPVYLRTRKRRPANYRTRTARSAQERLAGEQAVRNRLTTRALYDTDVESERESPSSATSNDDASSSEEEPEIRPPRERRPAVFPDGMQSDGGSYMGTTSCSDSANSSSDYSDWEVDNKSTLQPPSKKSNRKAKSSSPSQDTPSKSNSRSETIKKSADNRALRSRRRAKKRVARFNSSVAETSEDMENSELPPEWLTSDIPQKSPYFPQMGDEIMYFYQGHKLYVDEVKKCNLYVPKNLPWDKVSSLREQELVRIIGIKLEVLPGPPTVRLCCLKVAVIFPDSKVQTGTKFAVKYHDMPHVVDFMVLRKFYDISQQRQWQSGDRFRSVIDDNWFSGTIKSHEPYHGQHPDSPFLCFKITWEDGNDDQLSPWDLEPLADDNEGEKLDGVSITEDERACLQYAPDDGEWPECGAVLECERISNCIEQLMGYSMSELFNAPVDLKLYKQYAMHVAYLMDLSTIRSRLANGFYRRITAIQFDVRHIESNAEKFNKPYSKVVANARKVSSVCLGIISNTFCQDIRDIMSQLDLDVEYYAKIEDDSPKAKSKKKAKSFDWWKAAMKIIEAAFASDESVPFRAPPDLSVLPGYTEKISTPMDFATVKENLECNEYDSADEFVEDVRLIFANSRLYNINRRSKIFQMTIRLGAMVEEKIDGLLKKINKSRRGGSKKLSSRNSSYPVDTLANIGASSSRTTRRTRNSEQAGSSSASCSYNTTSHTSGTSASHYSTRSTTGTLKPKRFDDDYLDGGSFVFVSKKRRKILDSSDEDQSTDDGMSDNQNLSVHTNPPVARSVRNGTRYRPVLDSLSDYEKDTDAEEVVEEEVVEEEVVEEEDNSDTETEEEGNDINDDVSNSTDSAEENGERTSNSRTSRQASKRPLKTGNYKSKRAKVGSASNVCTTRYRTKGAVVGMYTEDDSDIEDCSTDYEDETHNSRHTTSNARKQRYNR